MTFSFCESNNLPDYLAKKVPPPNIFSGRGMEHRRKSPFSQGERNYRKDTTEGKTRDWRGIKQRNMLKYNKKKITGTTTTATTDQSKRL